MKKYSGLIEMIHPTQCTVGYAEVAIKMNELSKYQKEGVLDKYLQGKVIPGVLGPDNIIYITDHHHMAFALTVLATQWEKVNKNKDKLENPFIACNFTLQYNFSKSKLDRKSFLKILEPLNLIHPFDENGAKLTNEVHNKIPRRLIDLLDDPYRSLAGLVRKSGGYNKVNTPYVEFIWANFFREHITKEEIEKNFKKSIVKGVSLSLSEEANKLPGWKGIEILNGLKDDYMSLIQNSKKEMKDINVNALKLKDSIQSLRSSNIQSKPTKFNIQK